MLSTSRLAFLLIVVSAWLFRADVVVAQPRPLALDFVGCEQQLSLDALRIANIELASDSEASASALDAKVVVQCETDAAVVRASRFEVTVDKRLSFDTFDAATRARLIALGVAELMRELARPPVAPARVAPLETPVAKPEPNIPSWALSAGPCLRYASASGLAALGGRVVGERRIVHALSLMLAAEGTTANRAIRDGSLQWDHAALELGVRAFAILGAFRLHLEAALAGSFEHVSGEAREAGVHGDSFSTVNALGRLGLGADLTFLRHGLLSLTFDALSMLRSLEAKNAPVQTIEIGPWLFGGSVMAGARW